MKILSLKRLDETTRRLDINGDNWHTTWAASGRQFTSLCDGKGGSDLEGTTGADYNTRVLAIDGGPENPKFSNLPNFPDLLTEPETGRFMQYYGFGIIALGDAIYHYFSTPNHIFFEPNARFVGAKLGYSPDGGSTWLNQNGAPLVWEERAERSRDNMIFYEEDGDAFSLITALQMGRGYEENRDGYVYLYAPNGNGVETMNQLVLCRVKKEEITNRANYEFFASRDENGAAQWTPDIAARGVVHTFPKGWVNTQLHPYAWHPSVVYSAPHDCYLMANWGMGCAPDGLWFGKPSYLGFWTAPNPWGPWTQIHEETAWTPQDDNAARCYQPQIIPAWMAPDGKSFYLAWTDFSSSTRSWNTTVSITRKSKSKPINVILD